MATSFASRGCSTSGSANHTGQKSSGSTSTSFSLAPFLLGQKGGALQRGVLFVAGIDRSQDVAKAFHVVGSFFRSG